MRKKTKIRAYISCVFFLIFLSMSLCACGKETEAVQTYVQKEVEDSNLDNENNLEDDLGENEKDADETGTSESDLPRVTVSANAFVKPESLGVVNFDESPVSDGSSMSDGVETHEKINGTYLVAIDAGHQRKGNNEKEPIGPGATVTKAKVAGGTSGKTSGIAEYELTLSVALKLQGELEKRGYQVIQTRTSHDVNMSNAERAAVANNAGADVFIRIHANGAENTSVNGAQTICPTANNPYCANIYKASNALSNCVLDEYVAATGARKEYVSQRDDMSGINWCQVPVTILEMGYMTNPTEDANMASEGYQAKIVTGIANGIDQYFKTYVEGN